MNYPINSVKLQTISYVRCYAFPRMTIRMHYIKRDYIVPLIVQKSTKMRTYETATAGHKHTRHIVSVSVGGEHTFA